MMMDAVKIGTLPTTKPLLSKIYESTDSSRDKADDTSIADDNEDEEMRLRLSDEEENEQENITANVQNHQTSSQLKKADLELDTPAIVNSEETSEVSQPELKETDTNTERVDTTPSANPEEPSEVCQQESKDSTDTGVKEIDTPTSDNTEEKPEVSQQESKDLDTSVEKAVDTSDSAKLEKEEEPKQEVTEKEEPEKEKVEKEEPEKEEVEKEEVEKEEVEKEEVEKEEVEKEEPEKEEPEKEELEREEPEAEEAVKDCEQELKNSEATDEEDNLSSNGELDEEFLTENGNASDEASEMGDRMGHTQKYWAGAFNPRPWKGGTRKRPTFPAHRGSKSWYHQQYPDRDKLKKNNLHHSNSHFIRTSRSRGNFGSSVRDSWSRDAKRGETSESLRLKNKNSSKDVGGNKDNTLKQNGVANGLDHKENNSSTQNDKSITVINKADRVGVKSKEIISTLQSKRSVDPKLSSNGNSSASIADKVKSSSGTAEIEVLSDAQIQIKDVTSQNNGLEKRFKDAMDVDESTNDKPDSTSDLICIQSNIRDPSDKTGKNDDISCVTIVQEKSNGTFLEKRDQVLENNKDKDSTVKNYQSVPVDLYTESAQNNEDDWRDSESGSLVIDEGIQTKESSKDNAEPDGVKALEKSSAAKNKDQNSLNNVIEEVDLIDDDSQEATLKSGNADANASHTVPNDTINGDKINESSQDVVQKKRQRKRLIETMQEEMLASESENGGRQKRRSARNAEEMIRKEILKGNDDEENSSDDIDKMVRVNYRKSAAPNIITRTLSPPTLKRTLDEVTDEKDNAAAMALKRIRPNTEDASVAVAQERKEQLNPIKSKEDVVATGQLMRKMSQEDIRGKLKKLTQEELEALLLQKVVECITVRGEMGKLREQARASKKSQESLRSKCQQLQKQVEGFEMVLKRISYDKNSNGDKYVPPIKINRSVGLQVNFLSSEHGVQSLKQLQNVPTGTKSTNSQRPVSTPTMTSAPDLSPRKMMKTRSPRRPEMSATTMVQVPPANSVATQANPAATLVMTAKPADLNAKRNGNVLQIVSPAGNQQQTPGSRTLTIQRANSTTPARSNDLIDLTDEEDKSKVSAVMPITAGGPPTRVQRVLQAVPTGVTLGNATNLRLVPATNSQAGMGNSVQRIAYVMQGGPNGVAVPTRLQVLTSTTPMKGVTTITPAGVNYKRGVTALPNGAVRLLTTQAPTVQALKHPAPLPESPATPSDPSWKLAPPAPSLKISKVATGIVLSWNMSISDKYADIASYQLYAYQEVAGTPPSAQLWKKVGDVRALPLPMACTLTQFTEGNNYYFAVRAVDAHSRFGQYSKPGNISL